MRRPSYPKDVIRDLAQKWLQDEIYFRIMKLLQKKRRKQ